METVVILVFLVLGISGDGSFLISCSRSDNELIIQVLENRERALEKRDVDRYLGCISRDYHDSRGQDFSGLKERFEDIFSVFEKVDFLPGRRVIYHDGTTATVIQDYSLRFQPQKGDRFSRKGRERIILQKENEEWKIIDGL